MIIPALVAAAPAITAVTTANLHGCAVFIERRSTGDIVLYHVNADTSLYGGRNVNPPPAVVNRHPAFQTGDAIVKLMHLYNTARTSPALPGVTQDVRALFKAEYFQPVQAEIARKRHQGRKITELPVEVASVAGFYNAAAAGGPAWEFYCQTWLSLSYKRPAFSAKSFFWINTKRASNLNNVKVVGGAPLIVSYH